MSKKAKWLTFTGTDNIPGTYASYTSSCLILQQSCEMLPTSPSYRWGNWGLESLCSWAQNSARVEAGFEPMLSKVWVHLPLTPAHGISLLFYSTYHCFYRATYTLPKVSLLWISYFLIFLSVANTNESKGSEVAEKSEFQSQGFDNGQDSSLQ